jgi:hypothetical protein
LHILSAAGALKIVFNKHGNLLGFCSFSIKKEEIALYMMEVK